MHFSAHFVAMIAVGLKMFIQEIFTFKFKNDNTDQAIKQLIYLIIQVFISSDFETFSELLRQSHPYWSSKMRKS